MYPENYLYTKEHEWVEVTQETARIGITDYAQDELGDIVYVELPEIGGNVECMKVCGTIESVKAVSDLYAPVTGEVIAVNDNAVNEPELINEDAWEAGWVLKLKPVDPGEMDALMSAADYDATL